MHDPFDKSRLVAAEKRVGDIVAGIGDAKTQLAIAREGYAGAAERVQQAVAEREQALWPAAIEAAGDVLREMERAVATVLSCEGRLRSLASALREAIIAAPTVMARTRPPLR